MSRFIVDRLNFRSYLDCNGGICWMGRCILTGVELTEENDSIAHIIPSALGGRLKTKGILCREANNIMDRKADSRLIESFQFYMILLGGSRDRHRAFSSIRATNSKEQSFLLGTDMIKPLSHVYEVMTDGSEHRIEIKAISMKQAKDLIRKAKKELALSDAQEDDLLEGLRSVQEDPGRLCGDVVSGPAIEFPAAFAMAALFSAFNGLNVHSEFSEYFYDFDKSKHSFRLPPDTFYFIHETKWMSLSAQIGHCLFLYGDPERQKSIFVCRLFELLDIAVIAPFNGNTPVSATYGVDILEGKEVEVMLDLQALRSFDWSETHRIGDSSLLSIIQQRNDALMKLAGRRQFYLASKSIFDKYIGGADEICLTRAGLSALYSDLCFLLSRSVEPAHLEQAKAYLKEKFEDFGGI